MSDRNPTERQIVRAVAVIMAVVVGLTGVIDAAIAELEATKIASFQDTPALRGQLVLALDDDRRAVLHGFRLTYDLERGLVHERL